MAKKYFSKTKNYSTDSTKYINKYRWINIADFPHSNTKIKGVTEILRCKFIYPLYMTHDNCKVRSHYLCLHWEKYSAYLAFTFRFLLFGFCSFSGAASNSSKRSSCGTVDFVDEDFVSLCLSSSLSRNISSLIGWNLQAIDLQNKILNSLSEKNI